MSAFSLFAVVFVQFLILLVADRGVADVDKFTSEQKKSTGQASEASTAVPVPSFLVGAPMETVDSYHKMLIGSAMKTDDQIETAVQTWVAEQTPEIKTKYAVFKAELSKQKVASKAAHTAAVASLSPEARLMDAKLMELAENPMLSAADKAKLIGLTMRSLPASVRTEIEKAAKQTVERGSTRTNVE